jgi:glycyl-tRNA synthetase beta chain
MGMYYAREAGLPEAVALAARDHYSPLGPSDDVPSEPVSVAVALADKIDTLTGFWAVDEKPTGSKDPFALRRAALGVIRLVLENQTRIGLRKIAEAGVLFARGNILRIAGFHKLSLDYYKSPIEFFIETWREPEVLCMLNRDKFVDLHKEEIEFGLRDFDQTTYEEWDHVDADLASPAERDEAQKFHRNSENALRELSSRMTDLYWSSHDINVGKALNPTGPFFTEKVRANIIGDTPSDLLAFFHDRLKVYLRDQGIRHDVIDACLAMPHADDLTLLVKRARALAAFLKTDDGTNLLQGFKRANNILTQAEAKDGVEYSYGADIKYAETPEEHALFHTLDAAEATIAPAVANEDFDEAMLAMAALRAPIDAFFTAVQVNSDKQVLRRNRLNLLHRIRAVCSGVADLTKIEG